MPKVIARDGEPFQVLLRRFKILRKSWVVVGHKKNNYFEKPTVERRRKAKDARRKALKLMRKQARFNRSF